MNKSEKIEELITALIKAKSQFTPLKKSKTATVKMKSGGYYSYNYADLADILAMITPPLADNGLVIIQPVTVTDGQILIDTTLVHITGQWITTNLPLPNIATGNMNAIQQIGSVITYGRRYSVESLLGIASEEDTDGKGGEAAQGQTQAQKKAATDKERKTKTDPPSKKTEKKENPPPTQKTGAPKDPERQEIIDKIVAILKTDKFDDKDRVGVKAEIKMAQTNIALEALRAIWQIELNKRLDDFVDDIPGEAPKEETGETLTDEQMADLEKTANQGWFTDEEKAAKEAAEKKQAELDIY